MVGIIIVSHSKQLAQGVRELATQMVQGTVPLAIAAGVDDPENPLGTDVMEVHAAIESVYSDDGVVILMDLGSALMSAEMALEFLPSEQQEKVHLCAAPLVEGAIAAVVAAASGANVDLVIAEAKGALAAKAAQLGDDIEFTTSASQSHLIDSEEEQHADRIQVKISNRMGLHARPAAKFVATANQFQSQIRVQNLTKGSEPVRGDSINEVAMLGARCDDELAIFATGTDAREALMTLQKLIESNFGEPEIVDEPPSTTSPSSTEITNSSSLQGIPASPGVVIAPTVRYQPTFLAVEERYVDDVEGEWERLQVVLITAYQEIQILLSHASTQIGDSEAAIFDAHLLFLSDPALLDAVRHRIYEHKLNAEAAWQFTVEEIANGYRQMDDPYMQERAADMIDVGQRVQQLLGGSVTSPPKLSQPAILIAKDLTPSDTAQLDSSLVLGICITQGSATSHSAILARSLGIPAVVGAPKQVLQVIDKTTIALDGETGQIWIDPDQSVRTELQVRQQEWEDTQNQALESVRELARTRDGQRIKVLANISGIKDARVALKMGAEGFGLLRTEFLYLDRAKAPTEAEQFSIYQEIAQSLDNQSSENQPLIIRTLDVGGDKPLAYLQKPLESNPFLGWRGIRFCLDNVELFKTQLRAILRVSSSHRIKIMFPMIATLAELQRTKAILNQVKTKLRQENIPFDENMEVGMMIEIPSAVAIADRLATEVDFFSIGSNDLSQYITAADRTNPRVAKLADGLHPGVLKMINETIQAAHQAGIWVGLCGELASDPQAISILVGLGIDEISLNPHAIPKIKKAIAQLSFPEAEAIAQAALKLDSSECVRMLIS